MYKLHVVGHIKYTSGDGRFHEC